MTDSDEAVGAPTEKKRDYEVGYGKPPVHTRFKKGQSGNPRTRPVVSKSLAKIVLEALDQRVIVSENGRRRRVTKREAVIAQLVNKSAKADLRATKMLLDILREVERQAVAASAPNPADAEVMEQLRARLKRLAEAHDQPEIGVDK